MLETMLKILKNIKNSLLILILLTINVYRKRIRLSKDVFMGKYYNKKTMDSKIQIKKFN